MANGENMSSGNDATILVTGAAGGVGSTGFYATRLLLERGLHVRAFVHRLDERSDRLAGLGAEVVDGDLRDLKAVMRAMDGVQRAYFTYPVTEGLVEAASVFATAAVERGLDQVVNMSQYLQPGWEDQPTPHQARHWVVEHMFNWADVAVVHLDGAVFYEQLRLWVPWSLASDGVMALPWGPPETTIPLVAAEDIGRVAAAVLAGPTMADGTVLRLIADPITNSEIADALSQVLNREVTYKQITPEQWADTATNAGVEPIVVTHLSNLWRFFNSLPPGWRAFLPTDDIESLTGSRTKSIPEFFTESKDFFSEAAVVR
jgi:uncharacterized protein YbjT (DUF2867 family)